MICKTALSYNRSQELLDYLETMRLPEKPSNADEESPHVEEKKKDEDLTSEIDRLNNSSYYPANMPYLIYDENKETIISRTAKGINNGELNPYVVNWMEVTLYDIMFVKPLLEKINSSFIMDVAQAIDDEELRHEHEDGQFTTVSSDSYGTGQGLDFFYSHTIDNWNNNSVSAVSIAEGILDKRNKAEAYRKKIEQQKRKELEIKANTSSLIAEQDDDTSSDKQLSFKVSQLQQERDEWKKKYDEILNNEPEKAFNAQTGKSCFTSRQMGILLTAIGRITEKENPPGKTTLGEIIEKVAGYKSTTASSNMRGEMPQKDTEAVATAIESKFPNLAAEVRRV